jgi:hypothetical protein
VSEYLYIEAVLLEKAYLHKTFMAYIENDMSTKPCWPDDVFIYEVWELLITIKNNKFIIDKIYGVLYENFFLKLHSFDKNTQQDLTKIKNALDIYAPNQNNLRALGYFTAVWVFIGFCNSPSHNEYSFVEKEYMYISRYVLIGWLAKIFKKLIFKLEHLLCEPLHISKKNLFGTGLIIYCVLIEAGVVLKKKTYLASLIGHSNKNSQLPESSKFNTKLAAVGEGRGVENQDVEMDEKIIVFNKEGEPIDSIKSEVFLALRNPVWCNLSI